MPNSDKKHLTKFIVVSVVSFFIGSVHGVLQLIPPVRAWLDSIGSPYGGPGHMIDPLAHAHINLIGGVMFLAMVTTYYLLPQITGIALHSKRMLEHSFWWTLTGISSFYLTLMIFGVWEGILLLSGSAEIESVHAIYTVIIPIAASIMGIGLWIFLANVGLTVKKVYSKK